MSPQSPPPNASDPGENSWRPMLEVDRGVGSASEQVGGRCHYEYCQELSFLPFECQSCWKIFCTKHRHEDDHKSPNRGAWAERNRKRELEKHSIGEGRQVRDLVAEKMPCAKPGCKNVSSSLHTFVHCSGCNRAYCMTHRLREEHDCAKLVPVGARPGPSKGTSPFLMKLKLWAEKSRKERKGGSQSGKDADRRAANDLKSRAKGDPKIPPEKRIYLRVQAESVSGTDKDLQGDLFFSRDWAVGRMLDAAAKSLQVQNINNQSSDERNKLRVYHVEGGRLLEFSEKVGVCLANGNHIAILRGVGPLPDLITL